MDSKTQNVTFPQFSRLPLEIQDMVWTLTLPTRRIICLEDLFSGADLRASTLAPIRSGPPVASQVCKRSRNVAFLRGKRAKDLGLGQLLGDDVWLNPSTDTIHLGVKTLRDIAIEDLTAIVDAGFGISLSGDIRCWFYRNLIFRRCREGIWWDKYEKWQLLKGVATAAAAADSKQKSWEIVVGVLSSRHVLSVGGASSSGSLSDLGGEPDRLIHVNALHMDRTTRLGQALNNFASGGGMGEVWMQTKLRKFATSWCREQDRDKRNDDEGELIEDLARDATGVNMDSWDRWDEAKASFLSMLDGFQEFVPVVQIWVG